ncbi:hypothetical protein ACQKWADRAFT_301456 [Trichoderma austrokoningii]
MFRQLSRVPSETRSLIRHVRIASDALQVPLLCHREKFVIKRFFYLLLEMSLDTLTVFGPAIPSWAHDDLELFIQHGRGWKELRYITHTSVFVDIESSDSGNTITLRREPQPAGWQRDLEKRDGPSSGASVTMYKSMDAKDPLSVLCSTQRTELSYPPAPATSVDWLDANAISQSLDLEEGQRGISIVVKRGKNSVWEGVPRTENRFPSLDFPWVDTKDRRSIAHKDMKRLYRTYDTTSANFYDDGGGLKIGLLYNSLLDQDLITVVDNYRHVDDYLYPPHTFRTKATPPDPPVTFGLDFFRNSHMTRCDVQ